MSKLTDLIDNAGAAGSVEDLTQRIGWAVSRREADFAVTPVAEFGPSMTDIRAAAPAELISLMADPPPLGGGAQRTDEVVHADEDALSREAVEIEWSYRSHPIRVPNSPVGRAFVHTLYLLEADMLGDMGSAEQLHLVIEATRHALRSEGAGESIEERLGGPTPEAQQATTLSEDEASLDGGAPSSDAHHGVAAAAITCTGELSVFGGPGALPFLLSRLGRPALGVVLTGPGCVLRAARLLVQRVDGGASLDAVCRSAPLALGPGAQVRVAPTVAQSVRAALEAHGHQVTEDESLNGSTGCVGVALEDDGKVRGAGSGDAQVAQRAASSTSSQP